MSHEEDVDGDGPVDLLPQVATENLDPGTFWSGLIDDIKIYDRAVTP
jgi:hypothetical protein